jgi:MraZ protein
MFVGKYYNSIDSKSRLIVPAKFRDELRGKCVLAKALDKCLTIYTMEEWQIFADELDKLPKSNPEARVIKRHFNASAAECDIDKQGRLTIPQELKAYAGIEKDLVTVGSNKVIEVWSKEYWDDQLDPDSGELIDASEAAKGLEIYGF